MTPVNCSKNTVTPVNCDAPALAQTCGHVAGVPVPWSQPPSDAAARHACGLPDTLSYMRSSGRPTLDSVVGGNPDTPADVLTLSDVRHAHLGKYFKGRHREYCQHHGTGDGTGDSESEALAPVHSLRQSVGDTTPTLVRGDSNSRHRAGASHSARQLAFDCACPYSGHDFEPVDELRLLYPFD